MPAACLSPGRKTPWSACVVKVETRSRIDTDPYPGSGIELIDLGTRGKERSIKEAHHLQLEPRN